MNRANFQSRTADQEAVPEAAVAFVGEFVFSTYRSYVPAMDEGWSRWTFEKYGSEIPKGNYCKTKHVTTVNSEMSPDLLSRVKTIVFR